jgi:hypothetical protein
VTIENRIEEIIRKITGPSSGLWIPERFERTEVKVGARQIVAASRGYLSGTNATPSDLLQRLRALTFPDVVYVLASLGLIATSEPLGGTTYTTLARIFISQDELLSLAAAEQRERRSKPDGILLFTRTGVLLATKLAIALGENGDQTSDDLTRIGSFLLDANDFIVGARYRGGQGSADYKALMVEMLPSWDLSNPPEVLHALGRVYTMLREIALTDDARVRALVALLPRSLAALQFDGLDLDDYIAILFGIYGRLSSLKLDEVAVGRVNTVIDPESYLGNTKFPKELFERFLANRSKTLQEVRDAIIRNKPVEPDRLLANLLGDDEVADMTALRRSPLIRVPDGRILCADLPFITQLLTEGVYWTALETFNRIQRSHGDVFLSLWGRLFELYGANLLRSFYPIESGLLTIDLEHGSGQLDAVFDFGSYVILIEFKASLLTVAARCGRDVAAFETEFHKKFVENARRERKGIQQLADSVNAILNRNLRFSSDAPVIYSMLVCYESCVDSFWMNRYANEIFAQSVQGGLSPTVRPLTLVSMEGLEIALPYVAAGDFTWQTLLESRFSHDVVDERSVYQAIFDLQAANDGTRRINQFLKERFDRIFQVVMARYRGEYPSIDESLETDEPVA